MVVVAGSRLMSSGLTRVDEVGSSSGLRQERVSGGLENHVKASAFVHFLQTGAFFSLRLSGYRDCVMVFRLRAGKT